MHDIMKKKQIVLLDNSWNDRLKQKKASTAMEID